MKKRLAAATVIVTLCAPAAHAITMQGSVNCGNWISDQSSNSQTLSDIYNRAWLLGFMSGVVVGADGRSGDPFNGSLMPAQVFLWMDNFCRAKPLSGVADGVYYLLKELNPR